MIGSSPAMQALRARIAQVAPTPETVLITGESGTGKELVARAIHAASDRRDAPAGQPQLPRALGPPDGERAVRPRARGVHRGRRPADRPLRDWPTAARSCWTKSPRSTCRLQAKLLRVLQEKIVRARRLQQDRSTSTSACWPPPTATCRPKWRPAGSARTCTSAWPWCRLHVPPLRERREDIPELVDYFFRRSRRAAAARALHAGRRRPSSLLLEYHWPGNVRELENIVTRASVLHAGGPVDRRRAAPLADRRRPATHGDDRRRRPSRSASAWKRWNGG